jgi:hypothetical protein
METKMPLKDMDSLHVLLPENFGKASLAGLFHGSQGGERTSAYI